ncbi:MAG: hypothetical protein H6739_22275 [Alphaproteobacteria bacterium]|nr:hypothetical protein [Alphaproteobacteria bacterium]
MLHGAAALIAACWIGLAHAADAEGPLGAPVPPPQLTATPGLSRGAWVDVIPIALPPAPNAPDLALILDPTVRDGPLGAGARLDVPTITRRSATGGVPESGDVRLQLDGQDLIHVGGGYEPETWDGSRFDYDLESNTWTRRQDGWRWVYGETNTAGVDATVLIDEAGSETLMNTAQWKLALVVDPSGNTVIYDYVSFTGWPLLDRITYGDGHVEVRFAYEARPDPRADLSAGLLQLHSDRLDEITVEVDGHLWSRHTVEYQDEPGTDCSGHLAGDATVSRVRRVWQHGDAGAAKPLRCVTPHTETDDWSPGLDLTTSIPRPFGAQTATIDGQWTLPMAVSLNGDALPDLVVLGFRCNAPPLTAESPWNQPTPPFGCAVDHQAYVNTGGSFVADPVWESLLEQEIDATLVETQRGFALVDLDGDGQDELLVNPSSGAEVLQDQQRRPLGLSTFAHAQHDVLRDGTFADVDGDGLVDLVLPAAGDGVHWTHAETWWIPNTGVEPWFDPADARPMDAPLERTGMFGYDDRPADFLAALATCPSGANTVPTHTLGPLTDRAYAASQSRFTDLNNDGLTDLAVALYACWEEQTDAQGHIRDVPVETSLFSRIFYGDGRGGFVDSGLSAGRPFMAEVDLSHYGFLLNGGWFHTFREHFAALDLNRSGTVELLQLEMGGGGAGGVVMGAYDRGLIDGFGLVASGGEDVPVDFDPGLSAIGGQMPWPGSTVLADFDGDGFSDLLIFDPQPSAGHPPEDLVFDWQVELRLSTRTQPEGWPVEVQGPWGGTTSLSWGASALDNPDLPDNLVVLESEDGADGLVTYHYQRGTLWDREFQGFGLVERTNARGALEAFAFGTMPHVAGLPIYSAAWRTDGTLARISVASYYEETASGWFFDASPPYFNPLQRACEAEVGHGWTDAMGNRRQSVTADDVIADCLGWSTTPPGAEEWIASLGWYLDPPEDEPSADVLFPPDERPAFIALSSLSDQVPGPPVVPVAGEPSSTPVTLETPLPDVAPDFVGTHPAIPWPEATDPTEVDLSITTWTYDAAHQLTRRSDWRDPDTPDDDLFTDLSWGPFDATAWGARALGWSVSNARTTYEAVTRSRFVAFDLPEEEEVCGTGTRCLTTTTRYDTHGQIVAVAHPDGTSEAWSLEWCGLPTHYTDPVGRVRTTTPDALCRPEVETWEGVETVTDYDPFHRPEHVTTTVPNDDGTVTTLEISTTYDDDPAPTGPRETTLSNDSRLERLWLDGFGRPTLTSVCEDAGDACLDEIRQWTGYGSDGLPMVISAPYGTDGGPAIAETLTRDGLGRTIAVQHAAHETTLRWLTTRVVHHPGRRLVLDPLGREHEVITDTLGGERWLEGRLRSAWEVDPFGRTLWAEDPEGVTDYGYDDLHRLNAAQLRATTSCLPANGTALTTCTRAWSWDHDPMGRVTRAEQPDGVAEVYTWDGVGRLTSVTLDDGTLTTLESRVWTDATTSSLPRVAITDEHGNVSVETADALGRPQRLEDLSGVTTWAFGDDIEPIGLIDVNGRAVAFEHDVHGRRTGIARGGAWVEQVAYAAQGQPFEIVDGDGVVLAIHHTLTGLPAEVSQGPWTLNAWAYDDAGRVVEQTTEGVTESLTWDPWDRVAEREVAGVWGEVYAWTSSDRLASVTAWPVHSGTGTTRFTHDAWGELREILAPDGGLERRDVDVLGRLRRLTDAEGAESLWRYDPRGRERFHQDTQGASWSTRYASTNGYAETVVTDAVGATTTTWHDGLGRLVAEAQPDGTTQRFLYDGADLWQRQHLDATGAVLAREVTDFDTAGRPTTVWGWFDDPSWQPTDLPGLSDYVVDLTWTTAGRLDTLATPDETTQFDYDHGLLYEESWGAGAQTRRLHREDLAPWVTREERIGSGGGWRQTTLHRDAAGRLIAQEVDDGDVLVSEVMNLDAWGNPATTRSALNGLILASETWTYDAAGRPQARTSVVAGHASTTDWEWFRNGALRRVVTPAGRSIDYDRRLSGGAFTLGQVELDGAVVARFTSRDAMARATDVLTPDTSIAITYDRMGRIEDIDAQGAWGRSTWSGVFDDRGRLTEETRFDSAVGGWTNTYAYAEPGWLVDEVRGLTGEALHYELDAAGRRTEVLRDGALEQEVSWQGSLPSAVDSAILYDDDLDGITEDHRSLFYERFPDGSLSGIGDGQGLLYSFVRDASGRVVSMDEGGAQPRRTAWRLGGRWPLEVAQSDGTDRSYVVAEGLLLGAFDGQWRTLVADPRGSVLRSGASVVTPDAFGGGLGPVADDERFLFAGLELLPDAPGLLLARHRAYDADAGHFLSTDPKGLAGGLHRFRYAEGDPLRYVDPLGFTAERKERRRQRRRERQAKRSERRSQSVFAVWRGSSEVDPSRAGRPGRRGPVEEATNPYAETPGWARRKTAGSRLRASITSRINHHTGATWDRELGWMPDLNGDNGPGPVRRALAAAGGWLSDTGETAGILAGDLWDAGTSVAQGYNGQLSSDLAWGTLDPLLEMQAQQADYPLLFEVGRAGGRGASYCLALWEIRNGETLMMAGGGAMALTPVTGGATTAPGTATAAAGAGATVHGGGVILNNLRPDRDVGGPMLREWGSGPNGEFTIDDAMERGRQGEVASGWEKNTERIKIPGKPKQWRVPDHLDGDNFKIGEVKNVKYQHMSTQLKDYLAYAEHWGYEFTLKVRADTKLSSSLQQAVDDGRITLKRDL